MGGDVKMDIGLTHEIDLTSGVRLQSCEWGSGGAVVFKR
jgi:hypothetical protein